MTHCTLHVPSGTTITCSWTPRGGYDAIAFLSDSSRVSLVDEVSGHPSLWTTARWLVETSGLGSVDDLGEALVQMLLERGSDQGHAFDEIVILIGELRRMKK